MQHGLDSPCALPPPATIGEGLAAARLEAERARAELQQFVESRNELLRQNRLQLSQDARSTGEPEVGKCRAAFQLFLRELVDLLQCISDTSSSREYHSPTLVAFAANINDLADHPIPPAAKHHDVTVVFSRMIGLYTSGALGGSLRNIHTSTSFPELSFPETIKLDIKIWASLALCGVAGSTFKIAKQVCSTLPTVLNDVAETMMPAILALTDHKEQKIVDAAVVAVRTLCYEFCSPPNNFHRALVRHFVCDFGFTCLWESPLEQAWKDAVRLLVFSSSGSQHDVAKGKS
jgi:hypothetical protein